MSKLLSWKAVLAPKLHRLTEFLAWQGITTAGNLLYGFLCVRLLPIPEYAKFAVVFGALGTLSLLMDIGFSGTLISLIGERTADLQLIADYLASLRQLAHRLFWVVAPVAIVCYPLLVRRQHWSWRVVAAMVVILLVASWCTRISGAYGAVLIVRSERKSWYRAQMISSLGTLALLLIFWAAHHLNAFTAIVINVAGIVVVSLIYFHRSRNLLRVAGRPSSEKSKAIMHLAMPIIPNALFYAFQGQISLLLITLFGHAPAVASIGALSRLGQIFALFLQIGPLLIEPYFAKLPRNRLTRSYLVVVGIASSFCLTMIALARVYPDLFLWVLGHKYSGLRFEVLLAIISSSVFYLHSMFLIMHYARRFVYWWNNSAIIVLTIAVQVFFIVRVDLSTVRAVLVLSLATNSVNLLVSILTGIYGFVFGPRQSPEYVVVRQE